MITQLKAVVRKPLPLHVGLHFQCVGTTTIVTQCRTRPLIFQPADNDLPTAADELCNSITHVFFCTFEQSAGVSFSLRDRQAMSWLHIQCDTTIVTKSNEVVNDCLSFFNCVVSDAIYNRKLRFLSKLKYSDNMLFSLVMNKICSEFPLLFSLYLPHALVNKVNYYYTLACLTETILCDLSTTRVIPERFCSEVSSSSWFRSVI